MSYPCPVCRSPDIWVNPWKDDYEQCRTCGVLLAKDRPEFIDQDKSQVKYPVQLGEKSKTTLEPGSIYLLKYRCPSKSSKINGESIYDTVCERLTYINGARVDRAGKPHGTWYGPWNTLLACNCNSECSDMYESFFGCEEVPRSELPLYLSFLYTSDDFTTLLKGNPDDIPG